MLGDATRSNFRSDPRWVRLLAEVLMEDYPPDHPVVIYEAAAFPLDPARVDTVALDRLDQARFTQASTLYLEPVSAPPLSQERLARLGIDADEVVAGAYRQFRERF